VLWLLWIVADTVTEFLNRLRGGEVDFTEVETWIQDVTGEEVDLLSAARGRAP
jgi:hypothetical protein